jgi:hypothetical protein
MENAYALIIGIANYQHIKPLPKTVLKDAQDMYDLLINPSYCGYLPKNVQILLDNQATQVAISQALANLAQQSNKDSTVFIYISSHGGQIESGPHAGEYLLPVDTDDASEESIAQTAISGTRFTEALRAISARKIVVIFDCCHSGGIGQPKDVTTPIIKVGLPETYYEALTRGTGRVILASSRSTELSWILPGATNSLFTQHLLAGLQGGIASDDGVIRIFDLFEYLQPKVTADQLNQHPIFKAEVEENFPIALYLGGKRGTVEKDEEGFRYDAYVSYVEKEPDETWVWETLLPRVQAAGLRVTVSEDVLQPGVDRVVSIPRGIRQAKRTLVVLSEAYLADKWAHFEHVIGQTIGIQEGSYRVLPVNISPLSEDKLPVNLSRMVIIDFSNPRHLERRFEHLIRSLKEPLPKVSPDKNA